jgi:hypothetical protein
LAYPGADSEDLVATASLPVISPVLAATLSWLTNRVLALLNLTP